MSYIRSADAALYYEEYGTGETLILIPGLFGTIDLDWRRFIPEFARHFHTVAVDLRGHGKTDNPSGVLLPSQLVADLGILCETLEIEQPLLCTHGTMAFLPLLFALRSPETVGGIVLHAPTGILPAGGATQRDTAAAPLTGFTDDVLSIAHAPANGPDGWQSLLAQSSALLSRNGFPGRSEIRSLRVPVLITDGEEPVTGDARELSRLLPACRLSVLPQSGHLITSLQKPAFISTVLTFAMELSGTDV